VSEMAATVITNTFPFLSHPIFGSNQQKWYEPPWTHEENSSNFSRFINTLSHQQIFISIQTSCSKHIFESFKQPEQHHQISSHIRISDSTFHQRNRTKTTFQHWA